MPRYSPGMFLLPHLADPDPDPDPDPDGNKVQEDGWPASNIWYIDLTLGWPKIVLGGTFSL